MLSEREISMPRNYEAREKKLEKRKSAMKVNSRGLMTVIMPTIVKRGKEAADRANSRKGPLERR